MATVEQLITEHLDIWTSAVQMKSAAGRGKANKLELVGIKKLRELILELAVRGLLVPQDPNDEPASELLKRISAEKAQWVKDGKIKKSKPLPQIEHSDKPFHLPDGWEWVSFSHLGVFSGGKTPSKAKSQYWGGCIPWVTPKDMKVLEVIDSEDHITELAVEDGLTIYDPGSVLFVTRSGILRRSLPVAVAKVPFTVNQDLKVISPYLIELSPYIQLMARGFERYILSNLTKTGTTVESIVFDQFSTHSFMIPPLREQTRIISKVDELMILCDQLEQQQEASIANHQVLVQTLLDALTTASERDGFTAAWARITDHFDALFTTEWSIDQLKQTILQLAVMGKLVPQDPNDEPASVLLKAGAAEKEALIEDGKIKKQKSPPSIELEHVSYEVPKTWSWARLSDVSFFQEGPGILAKDFRDSGLPLIRIAGMHGDFLSLDGCNYLDESMVDKKWSHFRLDLDDIVLSASASLGKVSKVDEATKGCIVYTGLIRFKPYASLFEGYLKKFFESNEFVRQIDASKKGSAIKHFGPTHLKTMLIPIPPILEQRRITAKVDELIALCDKLKSQVNENRAIQVHLADAMTASVAA